MRETAKTMLAFLCIGVILVAAIVANFKYEEWRAEKVVYIPVAKSPVLRLLPGCGTLRINFPSAR